MTNLSRFVLFLVVTATKHQSSYLVYTKRGTMQMMWKFTTCWVKFISAFILSEKQYKGSSRLIYIESNIFGTITMLSKSTKNTWHKIFHRRSRIGTDDDIFWGPQRWYTCMCLIDIECTLLNTMFWGIQAWSFLAHNHCKMVHRFE